MMIKLFKGINMRVFLLIILCFLSTHLFAETEKVTIKSTVIPKGVTIGKQKVTAKKGYIFEKISDTHVVSRMQGGKGGITGEFDCTCNGEQGGCSAVTTPNSVTCASSGCTSCFMIVTIPDKKLQTMHQ